MPLLTRQLRQYDPQEHGARCSECPLVGTCKPVPPQPAESHPKLVLVGEAPSKNECLKGEPFIGATGYYLNREVFPKAGCKRSQLHITNALCCTLPKRMEPALMRKALDCCKPRLEKELSSLGADQIIMAAGGLAVRTLLDKGKLHPGSVHRVPNGWVMENFHPTFAGLRKPELKQVFLTFFTRALRRRFQFVWPRMVIDAGATAVAELTRIAAHSEPVGFDVETLGIDPLTSKLTCLCIADSQASISIPWDAYKTSTVDEPGLDGYEHGAALRRLAIEILTDANREVVTQNGQHDCLALKARGINVRNGFDTMLAHAVVDPPLPHDLEFIAIYHFPVHRWKTEFKVQADVKGSEVYTNRRPAELRLYNARDGYCTRLARDYLVKRLDNTHQGRELYRTYMRMADIAAKSRQCGIRIDRNAQAEHRIYLDTEIELALQNFRSLVTTCGGGDVNPSSPLQLRQLFFQHLHLRPTHWSEKTGEPALDKKALAAILRNGGLPSQIAGAILRYRQLTKLLDTYIDNLPVDADGRLRASASVHGARTGRWSYTNPNIHTIPKGKKEGSRSLRNLFSAAEGMQLVDVDYAALEVRIVALLAKDAKLLEWFAEGVDIHTRNATELFGFCNDELRNLAKTFVFSVNYGPTDVESLSKATWEQLRAVYPKVTLATVLQMVRKWFAIHPAIAEWRLRTLRQAKEQGYVEEPLSGRRRYFYGNVEDTKAYNFNVQAMGSTLIGYAMDAVEKEIDWMSDRILLQAHDAMLGESTDAQRLGRLIASKMRRKVTLDGCTMDFTVDGKIGPNWGYMKEKLIL